MTTLFSYFGKPTKSQKGDKSPFTNGKHSPAVKTALKPVHDVQLAEGELVWAKLGSHPWWPSMICKHPSLGKHAKSGEVHVQFLGTSPSRSWVKTSNICDISKEQPIDNQEVKNALKEAKLALSLGQKERVAKFYSCVPSDEEQSHSSDDETQVNENGKASHKRSREKDSSSSEDEVMAKCQRKNPRRKSVSNVSKRLKKRAKWTIASGSEGSEDDDNYKPSSSEDGSDENSSGIDEAMESEKSIEEVDSEDDDHSNKVHRKYIKKTPVKRKTKSSTSSLTTPFAPKSSFSNEKIVSSVERAQCSLAKFAAGNSTPPLNGTILEDEIFTHQKLKFLQDGHRKDKHGHLHTDPNYDQRTLLVPDSYLKSKEVTPAMRQWWILKSDNFDTVLFFKVGKFYELYNMDATIGVKELGLLYMKGSFAHAGFPEIAFSRYSDLLVQKGYKVARVEQTETPQMMNERCATALSKDKVVKREICAVISKGTKTYSFMEGDSSASEASYLLAVCERPADDSLMHSSVLGVCFVDTSIGLFHLGQFKDDQQYSRFRTLVSHYQPAHILHERNAMSPKLQHIITQELAACLTDSLSQGSEFWDAKRTLKVVLEDGYFNECAAENSSGETERPKLPETLQKMLSEYDSLGLTASDDYHLAISSFGACIWYLKKCCIEEELLSMAQFQEYVPLDHCSKDIRAINFPSKGQHLILDAVTLKNLDVIENCDGALDGGLLQQLDHCSTPFGKRLFKQWLCAPLCSPSAVEDRLNAIDDLFDIPSVVTECKDLLKTLPDLERLLRRIHSMGSLRRSKDHPDSRAILYNEDVYGKRKIADLLSALEGFEKAVTIQDTFKSFSQNFRSKLLRQVITMKSTQGDGGQFPDLEKQLKFFKAGFDHSKAKKDGLIIPEKGVHAAYDDAMNEIRELKDQFDRYLAKQKKRLGCSVVTYWGTGKARYQLEVPEVALKNNTPDDYHLKSQRKGFKRYWTDEIEELLRSLEDAEERRDSALKDTMRNLFNQFDKHRQSWKQAVECMAVLDCLLSLTFYRVNADSLLCRPTVVAPQVEKSSGKAQPFIVIRNSRHPCITKTYSGGDFIPNDIMVGKFSDQTTSSGYQRRCVIVTGPNMGGKSTLMRQAGLLTIMAQLGSYVPAEECSLTPCDRIFTRLGAQDRILQGESTFFVELSETSTILRHATEHSLVLLDELGRGTATYDGTAIASAVIRELVDTVMCRTLFSTHYHTLVDELSLDPRVKLGHMACMVENDEGSGEREDPSQETITFLYRFVDGSCPKSYGFNAAKLAGIPLSVIREASKKAKEFELATKKSRLMRRLFQDFQVNDKDKVSALLCSSSLV